MRGGVFVCHASADAGVAQRVVAVLEADGVPCWIAPRDIDPGENYTQAILDGLEAAPAVVLVFSEATNESPHVQRELETAVGAGRAIVPVRLAAVEPSRSLRYFIGTSHWLDTSGADPDEWGPPLVRAVRRAVGLAPQPDELPTRPTHPPPPRRRGPVLLVALATAAVAAVAVAAVLLTGGDDDGNDTAADPVAQLSSGSARTTGGATAATSATETPTETRTEAPTEPVTCWDGSSAPDQAGCPVPTGLAGLMTVFPSLTEYCSGVASPVAGKAEVFECRFDGFLVRYTRWEQGFDKFAYHDIENQVPGQPWVFGTEPAGLQWTSIEDDPAETLPYQWSAAYRSHPFSVSVEGVTSADRSAGIATLHAVPASRVGLR